MATQLLVTDAIESGRRLLEELDRTGFPVNAALWYMQAGNWRYLIASEIVDRQGPMEAYRRINEVLQESSIDVNLADVAVISSHDPLVRLLRSAVGTPPHANIGIRFTANTINNVFIEDAYIYRMA